MKKVNEMENIRKKKKKRGKETLEGNIIIRIMK